MDITKLSEMPFSKEANNMRIKKVRIRNFRSIIDSGEISLDDKITVLLGKNEQGKTNLLKALESFGREYKYENDDLSYLISSETELQQLPIDWIMKRKFYLL